VNIQFGHGADTVAAGAFAGRMVEGKAVRITDEGFTHSGKKQTQQRVHVGIGLIRKQLGMGRWNQERPDLPEEFKKTPEEQVQAEVVAEVEEKPKKRGRKKASEVTEEKSE